MGIWFYFHNVCVCVWIWWGGETAWVWSFPMKCSIEQRQRRGQPQIRCYTKQSNIHLFEGIKSHSRSWYWFRVFFFSLFLFSHTQSEQLNLFRSFHSDIWLQKFEIEIMIRRIDCRGEAGRYPPISYPLHWLIGILAYIIHSACCRQPRKNRVTNRSDNLKTKKYRCWLSSFNSNLFIIFIHSFRVFSSNIAKWHFLAVPEPLQRVQWYAVAIFFFFFNIHIPRIRWSSNA